MSFSSSSVRSVPFPGHRLMPGVILCAALAGLATGLHALREFSPLSPMILAILLGMLWHNLVGTPTRARAGAAFSMRRILRAAIVLLGLQLTLQQVVQVGLANLFLIAATLVASFLFTKWLGALLGIDRKLAELIAAGTAICGASAVMAVDSVTRATDEDVAYAVGCVTIFGGMAMFIWPLLFPFLHLTPAAYGLWAGASIHEIAQVVAAGFQHGAEAGHAATVAKLARVSMLAPLVFLLGIFRPRFGDSARKVPGMPIFILGFVAMVVLNSLVAVPLAVQGAVAHLTSFLLALSLAAMGLHTDLRKLRAKGLRPLLLGGAAWLFIGCFSLILVKWMA